MEGEGEGEQVRDEMGWQWPHSQQGDCRLVLLLGSGRMLIPWIYTHIMLALSCGRICDCTPEIHYLLVCLQACTWTLTLVYLVQFIDPHTVTTLHYILLQIVPVHNHLVGS